MRTSANVKLHCKAAKLPSHCPSLSLEMLEASDNHPAPAKSNFQAPKAPDFYSELYVKILQCELPGSEQKLKHFILESQRQDSFISPATATHTASFDLFPCIFFSKLDSSGTCFIKYGKFHEGKSIISVRKGSLTSVL